MGQGTQALQWRGQMDGVNRVPRCPVFLQSSHAVGLVSDLARFAAGCAWQVAEDGEATSLAEWVAWWLAQREVGPGDDAPVLQQRRWAQGLGQWVAKVVMWWEGQPCGAMAPAGVRILQCRDPARRGQGGLYQLGWPLSLLTPLGGGPPRWAGPMGCVPRPGGWPRGSVRRG